MNIRWTCVLLITLILAVGCATRPDSPNPAARESAVTEAAAVNMESRIFDFPPTWEGATIPEDSLKQSFADMGNVSWPPGSFARHIAKQYRIVVKNTPNNLSLIEDALPIHSFSPRQIEVQFEFVEYSLTDIDALAREDKLSAEGLLALWRQGKAKLLYSPRIVTQSGQEATVKGGTEYIYPTSFDIAYSETTNAAGAVVVSGIVEPSAFETREVGVTLALLPVMRSEDLIYMALTPEIVRPPTWKNYGTVRHAKGGGKDKLRMEQPFFHTHSLLTVIIVSNETRLLVGGGMNNEAGDKFVYVFATTRLLDASGKAEPEPRQAKQSAKGHRDLAEADKVAALESHSFPVHPTMLETMKTIHDAAISPKEFLGIYGRVEWPHGADAIFNPFGQLTVINTSENVRRARRTLATLQMIPTQVEIQADFVEYRMEDVDALARENKLDPDNLLALWKQGRAQLRYAPRIVTQSGQEATIKGVTEYIYPTAFDIAYTGFTNAAGRAVVSGEVVPQSFETREVGVVLAVLPDVSPDGRTINLTMTPETVRPPTWKNYGTVRHAPDGSKDALLMEQPFFHTHTLTTQAIISDGGRVMLGGGMNNEGGDKTVYVFLTARLIDTEGRPILVNEARDAE